MSFMRTIEACRPPALELLASDWLARTEPPGLPFCRRVAEVPDPDMVVARRLGVSVATVRAWRDLGGRGRR